MVPPVPTRSASRRATRPPTSGRESGDVIRSYLTFWKTFRGRTMSVAETAVELDSTKTEAFGRKMVEMLNHAALALMTSIGHRTGLFDVMSRLPRSTSEQIAAEAGLSERYVREWLGAMVTGGIVEYEPQARRYRLPAEHAAWLTREASPNNVAVSAQWIAVLGSVEDQVVEAFRHGKGVPYSAYPPVPRGDGRGERPDRGRGAVRPHPAAGARARGPARRRASTCSTSAAAAAGRCCDWPSPSRPAASPATTLVREASPPAGPRPAAARSRTSGSRRTTSRNWARRRPTT